MRRASVIMSAAAVVAAGWCTAAALADGQIPDRATLDAILGGGQTLEDFESFVIADGGATVLDIAVLDDQSIALGQGPGLVEDGATYSSTTLQWNGNAYYSLQSRTFLANAETLTITYDPVVTAMGLDARAFVGYGYNGSMRVYDLNNALVGTINFSLSSGGAENVFLGWEWNAGISRVEIDDSTWSWSPVIDNHGYGEGGTTYRCSVSGQCPGTLTVSWQNANPGRQQGIVFASNTGSFVIPGGVCQGTQLGLGSQNIRLVNTIGTGNGSGSVNGNAGTSACGGYLQLVEVPGCATSNVAGPI